MSISAMPYDTKTISSVLTSKRTARSKITDVIEKTRDYRYSRLNSKIHVECSKMIHRPFISVALLSLDSTETGPTKIWSSPSCLPNFSIILHTLRGA